jgi:hypothetical protein
MTLRRLGISALLTALLAAALPLGGLAQAAQPARAGASCRTARGPFRVVGTKVLGAGGKVFVPYGITVPGLAIPAYRTLTSLDDAKIRATARYWCANTVRLQLGQGNLVGPNGRLFVRKFLRAVEGEVSLGERLHLVVVLTAQTQNEANQPAPTKATVVFWKDLSRVYGHDRQVIFDLFNEPRISTGRHCGDARDWTIWHSGGRFLGHSYIGMQTLVHDVRADGARNLLWVEGPCYANSLNGLGSHRITGEKVVYAFHHPHGVHDAAQWYTDFGWVIARHVGPVVDSEWTNYASNLSECWDDAPTAAAAYLRYLARYGIGMIAYQLKKGMLISTKNLADPTHIYASGPRKWRCANGLDEGAGAEIMNWFRRQNS